MTSAHSKRILALVGIAAVLTACGGGSDTTESARSAQPGASAEAETASLSLGLVQGQDFIHAMPARVAEAEGIFEKHGLDVEIVGFSGGSDLTKAMTGGSVDVGATTGLDAVVATAKGVDSQAFYGVRSASPMAITVAADSTVRSFADLKGKKLGISKFGSLTDFTARSMAKKAGLEPDAVTRVPLGAPSANIAALEGGEIDAFLLPRNYGLQLEAKGTGKLLESTGPDADEQFAVLTASSEYLSDEEAAARRLTEAYADAIAFIQENREETVALAVEALGMTPEIAGATYDAYVDDFSADGAINLAGMKAYADALPELELATSAPSEDKYYTDAFL